MSTTIPTWPGLARAVNRLIESGAWSNLSAAAKATWLPMAKHANNDGITFASKATTATEAGLTPRGVHKAIDSLRTVGLIEVEAMSMGGNPTNTTRYRMLLPMNTGSSLPMNARSPLPMNPKAHTPEPARTQPLNGGSYKSPINPQRKPHAADADVLSGFAAFWEAWPKHSRKAAKSQCLEKWKSHGCESITADVMAALERAKASTDWRKQSGQFIPAPLVWLNQSRWEAPTDETPAPTPTAKIDPSKVEWL